MYRCKIFYKSKKGGKNILMQKIIRSKCIKLVNGVYKCWCNDWKCGLGYRNIVSIYVNGKWCQPVQVSEIL